nr:methyltransferase [Nocardioidaceae bacterium]
MSDHYFTVDPSSSERRQPVTARVWGRELTLQSAAGVFAAGRLDVGTSVLFRETKPPTSPGPYLDLGCGYGAIACALATLVPEAQVWAIDVNERALRLCRHNAKALRVEDRVRAVAPAAIPTAVQFDEIWSNPPIRIGKAALHELLLEWLPRLTPAGRAVLVVGKNLGADSLQRWISEQGFSCVRLASAKGFRVLEARPVAV